MARAAVPAFSIREQSLATQALAVMGASLFIALCARVNVPLPFTPVPLTLSNFAVLLIGLAVYLLYAWRAGRLGEAEQSER